MIPRRPISSLLVKPAGPDCNLACEYCFYLQKEALFGNSRHRMSDETLELTIRQALEGGGPQVSFGWQGGEPTLMGLDFFRNIVKLQGKYRRRDQVVMNGLQTNGWLIDSEWREFLRDNRFLVGLSLDGPAHVHDRYRKTPDGRATFKRVCDNAQKMLEEGVETNALVVVNDYSARYAREIYDFHYDLGFRHMQFIPCVEPHAQSEGLAAPFSVSGKAYGKFLCELFDRWREDFKDGWPTVYVRYFESLMHIYCGVPAPDCNLMRTCGGYVVVEHNGDVYSCDFFVDPQWRLGSVSESTLVDMLNSEKQREFGEMKADLPSACGKCEWLRLCMGGCTKDRLNAPLRDRRTPLCAGQKMFFEHTDQFFRRLADKWRRAQAVHAERNRQQQTNSSRNAPCSCGSGKKFKNCCGR